MASGWILAEEMLKIQISSLMMSPLGLPHSTVISDVATAI